MSNTGMSRRAMIGVGACTLAAGAVLPVLSRAAEGTGPNRKNEELIRKYYSLWRPQNEWHSIDVLMTDDFTFTSPVDDHISKAAFKKGCWDTQHGLIAGQNLEEVFVLGDQAFVRYTCQTTNGKSFRNVEYHQLKDHKIAAIECYFGGAGYPSEANKTQK